MPGIPHESVSAPVATPAAAHRERVLAHVFVELADTLVDDFDVADFLRTLVEQCVHLMEVSAAGVVLTDPDGRLRMAAASSERAGILETLAVQADDGPCIECVRTGRPVLSTDLPTKPTGGPSSRPRLPRPDSGRRKPFRCGCAARSSAR